MDINQLRRKIEQYDTQIVDLLNKRAKAVVSVGKAKAAEGRDVFDPARQKTILDRLCRENPGPFPANGLRTVFNEIMSACLSLEEPLHIGFFGPEATYTHMAAKELFGSTPRYMPYKTIEDVFEATEKSWAKYGVVPIENSAGGVVHVTLDRFIDSNLIITAETTLSIHHVLMANCEMEQIKRVYSHPQPFLQCRAWLKENLPGVELQEVEGSTVEGAKLAAQHKNCAAIASELAAKMYNLNVLVKGIEDLKDNITRFWVIGDTPAPPTGNDKTSVMFSIKDRPGALYDLLQPLHRARINLTKIESRPTKRRAWEYVFFVDMLGHITEERIAKVLHECEKHCEFVKVMGSYPRDDRPH